MDDHIDCFLIRESEKARLMEIESTKVQIWIPKSVTPYIMKGAMPDPPVGQLPGLPCLIKVEGWWRRKNPEAFGD